MPNAGRSAHPMVGALRRAGARWVAFENAVFVRASGFERRVRRLPPNVRLVPSRFDRRVFRLFGVVLVVLAASPLLPTRTARIQALLLFLLLLVLALGALAYLDTKE